MVKELTQSGGFASRIISTFVFGGGIGAGLLFLLFPTPPLIAEAVLWIGSGILGVIIANLHR